MSVPHNLTSCIVLVDKKSNSAAPLTPCKPMGFRIGDLIHSCLQHLAVMAHAMCLGPLPAVRKSHGQNIASLLITITVTIIIIIHINIINSST